jgi:hypothetical protein
VCLSVRTSDDMEQTGSHWRIFMKFYALYFHKLCRECLSSFNIAQL